MEIYIQNIKAQSFTASKNIRSVQLAFYGPGFVLGDLLESRPAFGV